MFPFLVERAAACLVCSAVHVLFPRRVLGNVGLIRTSVPICVPGIGDMLAGEIISGSRCATGMSIANSSGPIRSDSKTALAGAGP